MTRPAILATLLSGNAPDLSAAAKATAQAWLRGEVADVAGGLIHRGDGALVAVLEIEPANIALLSDRERAQRIRALHEALQGIRDAFQILALPRPIDLDAYIGDLDRLLAAADPGRRRLLGEYARYVRRVTGSGEAMERRFYLVLPLAGTEARRKGAAGDLLQRAAEVSAALGRADLRGRVLDDRGLIDLLHTFLHPATSAFERGELPAITTRYIPPEEGPGHADAP